MNQPNFEQLSNIMKNMQRPIQEMTELNIRTLKDVSYLKPEDLISTKKPDELFEKQVEMVLANGRKALKYFEESFDIVEKALTLATNSARDIQENFKEKDKR